METPHSCVFIDEAGFDVAKTCRRRRNVIGQRATVRREEILPCVLQWPMMVCFSTHHSLAHTTQKDLAQLVPPEQGEPAKKPPSFFDSLR